jgi:hypothetical protein
VPAFNGQRLFFAAWVCGVIGIVGDVGPFVAAGGVLLLVTAYVVWTHPEDPFSKKFDSAGQGPLRGRPFLTTLLVLLGAGWLVFGIAS